MAATIAIVIVNYRTPDMTLDCLQSLQGEIDRAVKVVVVDNASGDDSCERIERAVDERGWASWVRVVRAPTNAGFASGNNIGIRTISADAYILLNSDTLVRPGAISGLREAMEVRPDAGIIGPELLDADGGHDNSVFRAPRPSSELLRSSRLGALHRLLPGLATVLPSAATPMEADWLGFACVLVRREVIEQVGPLDEGYFMYFEDIDYCRRAREAGWKILYWPAPKVVHLLGRSSQVTAAEALRRRAPRYYYEARARYFAKYYGRHGLWITNGFWHLGRCISLARETLGATQPQHRQREYLDIWTNALMPLRAPSANSDRSSAGTADNDNISGADGQVVFPDFTRQRDTQSERPSHGRPLPNGTTNQNPTDIGLLSLLAEDLRTHDRSLREPGFWALAVHRLGNARMEVRSKLLRAPLTLAYEAAFTGVNWLWGIDLSYTVKLGRRVRIWHHGGIILGARAIGDDVHLRQNTTLGVVNRQETDGKPIIGNRVDIGAGACVVGAVTVGDDCVIGANTVVTRDLPPGATVFGVPARPVNLQLNESMRPKGSAASGQS